MSFNRRQFLAFLGASAGTTALSPAFSWDLVPSAAQTTSSTSIPFTPIQGVMPLTTDGIAPGDRIAAYSTAEVVDDLVLPESFTYSVIGAWGDKLGDSRFGYNNDYIGFVETAPGEGYLTINFEYISAGTWSETFEDVIGESLEPLLTAITPQLNTFGIVDAFTLRDETAKAPLQELAKQAYTDQGIGILSIRKTANGDWERTYSSTDRRITGISGLEDDRYLKATGPAVDIFEKPTKQGYEDGLGSRIIGTFGNCAGGTTPWGTILSAEENFQSQVPEFVMADGSSISPSARPFQWINGFFIGQGNPFGLAGNKYGWIVEVDPTNPNDYGTKHTWLGRFRHEAVAVRAVSGQPLAVYSGCDRRGGHIYKFVSSGIVTDPTDKTNSDLLKDGTLYVARFNSDNSGDWIPLTADTPVNPVRPSEVFGNRVTLPHRPGGAELQGGVMVVEDDEAISAYRTRFQTLGELYDGTPEQTQGAILIDSHFAANAAGATATARPEDTILDTNGTLFIAFTSGASGSDGGPHKAIFNINDEPSEYGWIFKLAEVDGTPASTHFRWDKLAVGGEPADGGLGFSNPDNLEVDPKGNLWMVTDMSNSSQNQAVPAGRLGSDGEPISQGSLRGLYGNNSMWYIPLSGDNAGKAFLFAYGPMDSELTGPKFTTDGTTLFVSAQHPGGKHGSRNNMETASRQFDMRTPEGESFLQIRSVPIGSNWPGKAPTDSPRPAIVAIHRTDGSVFV